MLSRATCNLPILVTDEEIYRRLPAFMIATVDKFAALPWEGEVGAFFGHVQKADAQGFYGRGRRRWRIEARGATLLPLASP